MPTYQFEAMDPQGQEIKDVIDAPTQDEAQTTIRSMGYFVTKISVQKAAKGAASSSGKSRKTFALGGAGGKKMVTFTRQLSILQDAGLPILRSLKILEEQALPWSAEEWPDRRLRRDRRWSVVVRSDVALAQGF